ncbi:MAG: HU family DNA-binding protein [Holosporaceae bacterium]|nr:HU family DNA-binding protein [Alphaproteobacteria bacterium]MCA3249467.1 HU family DNA-binding protein [Rhodospirillaceae bacterium]
MNKSDLIAQVAEKTGVSKTETGKIVDCVLECVEGALKSGDEVRLIGFGTFTVAERAAKEGRNPQTGAKINIPASKLPKFKPHTALKDAVAS